MGSNQSQLQILVGFGVFVTLRKQLAENAYKIYHVYKVIAMLHIYNKKFGYQIIRTSCKLK